MSRGAYAAYQNSQVLEAAPVQLICLLYKAAREAAVRARQHHVRGDIFARGREISRAVELIAELAGCVDPSQGGEIALNLVRLYDYMQRRLQQAHLEQSAEPLSEVETLLMTLETGWEQIASGSPPDTVPVQDSPASAANGFTAARDSAVSRLSLVV